MDFFFHTRIPWRAAHTAKRCTIFHAVKCPFRDPVDRSGITAQAAWNKADNAFVAFVRFCVLTEAEAGAFSWDVVSAAAAAAATVAVVASRTGRREDRVNLGMGDGSEGQLAIS